MLGKQHDKLINILAAASLGFGLILLGPTSGISFAAGVYFGGHWLSPDLDLWHSIPSKRWLLLRFIWRPYASLMPHRNPLSHWPILSDAIRWVYFVLWLALVSFIAYGYCIYNQIPAPAIINAPSDWLKTNYWVLEDVLYWMFLGNCLATAAHATSDWMWSRFR